MERTISVEEKIRRAEEIYAKRKQGEIKPIATVNVNEKKDIKLLRKMIIQILICIFIYFVIYAVQSNSFPFSEDLINKTNELISYDTNFGEIYQFLRGKLEEIFIPKQKKNEEENIQEENTQKEGIGGAEETNESINKEENTQNTENLSQVEQDIIAIKNTTNFIKPVEGIISSKYGQRDEATGTVPKNHTGTDIAAQTGTKIKSATDGEVVLYSEEGDYRKASKNTNWRSKYYLCTLQ
jgi:murein DD-endopeptidase MepM/ murein hydrolase activator NlpD